MSALMMLTCVLLLLSLPLSLCDQLFNFDFGLNHGATIDYIFYGATDPCADECKCYSWKSAVGEVEDRFTVNCTGMEFGFFQGVSIPKNLPFNTTDLVVSEYFLGTLSMSSFPNQSLQLFSVSLEGCHITYLSSDTFQSNSLVSIRNVSLGHNSIELLTEGTFWHLPSVENISIDSNVLQKVHTAAFRNLPRAHAINLSHNILSEIQLGAFDNLPLLEVLDLSHNWLNAIPGEDIFQLPSLKVLSLQGNFWNCSCEMSWILKLNRSILIESQARCLYPKTLNGTAFQHLTVQDFQQCFSNGTVVSYAYYSVPVLLIVCSSLLLYACRSSKQSNLKVIGSIEFDPRNVLGGQENACVFKGKLRDGRHAAVKQFPRLSKQSSKELEILLHMSEKGPPHPNVIQYLWIEEDSASSYIALELCGGNLSEAISNSEKFLPFLTPECCLCQVTLGLRYLHNLQIQHRDIKPQNILWKYSDSKSDQLRFLVADFDLGHFSTDKSSHRPEYGTIGWSAPELWNRGRGERTTAVDIFSLGCVFYYVLTSGGHPFGSVEDMKACQQNIDESEFSLSGLSKCNSQFVATLAEDLIGKMIQSNAPKRPTACSVLDQPLFWNRTRVLTFFDKIGNYMEDKTSSSIKSLKDKLEHSAAIVFQENWKERLDKAVQSDIKAFNGKELCSLLRVVRNKIVHYGKLREELRAIYLGSPEGVVQYYIEHFPKLLIHTYCIEQEWEKEQNNSIGII